MWPYKWNRRKVANNWFEGIYSKPDFHSKAGGERKNKFTMSSKNFDDLLIFGYACKIFRDDEKALHIDKGKNLIPWAGDSTLKIDR